MKILPAASLGLAMAATIAGHGQLATTVNDNSTVPGPPNGSRNIYPANDSGHPTVNVSHYVVYPTYQVDCLLSADLSAPISTALADGLNANGAILDARACRSSVNWTTAVTINIPDITILLPCINITATHTLTVAPGVRNTNIVGCGYMGSDTVGPFVGGTSWIANGNFYAFTVGDPTGATQTQGFRLANMVVDNNAGVTTTGGVIAYDTQDIKIEDVYFDGPGASTGDAITFEGESNYTGGRIDNVKIADYQGGILLTTGNTGGANASTISRTHIVCPTSGGSPIGGTFGIIIGDGDGNTIVGGDVEGCDTMLYLGSAATNNTSVGLRSENFNSQISAVSGSSYNSYIGGSTLLTGKTTDAGTHNSLQDAFHRGFNQLNGDIWRSQADTDVTDHIFMGIGVGNVRGRQEEYATDVPSTPSSLQNMWLWGPGDGTGGVQLWQLEDLLNSVSRFGVATNTTAGGSNTSYLNGAGTGPVCFQCSAGSGTGGVNIASGGATPATIASFDTSGNFYNLGRWDIFSGATDAWRWSCASTSACTLQSETPSANAYHLRAFNGAGTEIDSEGTSAVTVNNTSTSGTGGFIDYLGQADSGVVAFSVSGYNGSNANVTATVGSASGFGNLAIGNHLNQLATTDFAGSCTVTSTNTTCTISFQHSWTSQPACSVSAGFQSGVDHWYTWATNVVTIHEATSADGTWYVICAGNPN